MINYRVFSVKLGDNSLDLVFGPVNISPSDGLSVN